MVYHKDSGPRQGDSPARGDEDRARWPHNGGHDGNAGPLRGSRPPGRTEVIPPRLRQLAHELADALEEARRRRGPADQPQGAKTPDGDESEER
ncbi:hypothetical protein [uncultured Tistrella sp.]|uniref:hypothetical protein n=1 Tax=Tistrella mobilis TaxID=171437 RepID=UPI000C0B2E35|nr:hypothetical protein [uncultured Tistrella sp.]MAM77142.1 hypothetical protein [Tistrella sp.]